MKFVKRIDEITKKPYVFLDLEGMKLDDASAGIDQKTLDFLCSFHIETYKILKGKESDLNWETVFGTVHAFLGTMTSEEQQKFAAMIIYMHWRILNTLCTDANLDPKEYNELAVAVEKDLSQRLATFDAEVNLINRLIAFTQDNIPIQSFAGVGERPQDTPSMTFHRKDVVELTAVALLCKMMTPIFGVFIDLYKKKVDSSYKELHCVAILKGILANRCAALIEKLINFIHGIVKPSLSHIGMTHICNGYTIMLIVDVIYSQMLTKRFIGVNFYETNSNLITYVTSCARSAANTQFGNGAFKRSVTEIDSPDERASDSDDGNMSGLEVESRVSSKPADYPIIIKAAAAELIKRFVPEHDLDEEEILQAQQFYEINHIALTPVNEYLLGILFGSYLCGAKSIDSLDGITLAKIVPIMQTWLLQQGYYELVVVSSIQATGRLKNMLSGNDTQLKSLWNSSFEYKNCANKFTYCVDKLRWDTGLKNLVDNLVAEEYMVNLAPVFWDKLQQANRNGEIYANTNKLPQEICGLILQMYP